MHRRRNRSWESDLLPMEQVEPAGDMQRSSSLTVPGIGHGRPLVKKSKTLGASISDGFIDPRWTTGDGHLKPELAEVCKGVAHKQAARLPRSSSEARLARNRMPSDPLEHLMRQGKPLEQVAEEAALRLVEHWIRYLMRNHVPPENLATVIAELVHEDRSCSKGVDGGNPLPTGLFGSALRRLVPRPADVEMNEWNFLDELLEVLEMETEFDKKSFVHIRIPARARVSRLSVLCGGAPTVWGPGDLRSTFPRTGFVPREAAIACKVPTGMRSTSVLLSGSQQCKAYESSKYGAMMRVDKVPGPAEYMTMVQKWTCLQSPRRADFSAVGLKRPVCTVDALSNRPRMKGDKY